MSNHEDYSPAAVRPFALQDPALQEAALRQAHEQQSAYASREQQFSAIHVDVGATTGRAIIRPNSLFGGTQNADQQYIATQYIAAFPDYAYVSLDLPGHGASDPLTKEQRKDIAKSHGSLRSVAQAQVEAVRNLDGSIDDIILTGEAMGSLFALEFAVQAAQQGMQVRKLFGFDPLGMEDRSPIQLASGYLSQAQKSRHERKSEAADAGEQVLEDAFSKVFKSQLEALGPTQEATRTGHAGIMAKERAVAQLMFKKSPLTRATGMRALEESLGWHPEMEAYFVFAGRSVVGRLTDEVRGELDALAATSDRVQYDEWPYDNQDIGLARHQPRLVKYVADHV